TENCRVLLKFSRPSLHLLLLEDVLPRDSVLAPLVLGVDPQQSVFECLGDVARTDGRVPAVLSAIAGHDHIADASFHVQFSFAVKGLMSPCGHGYVQRAQARKYVNYFLYSRLSSSM